MDFFKSRAWIFTILLAVLAVATVIWYCLAGSMIHTEPNGTLVEHPVWEVSV